MDDASLNKLKKRLPTFSLTKNTPPKLPDVDGHLRPTARMKKSCDESAKVLGLVWGLYSTEDKHKLTAHIQACGFCQKEHLKLSQQESRVKLSIPAHKPSNDLIESLSTELMEVTRNTFNAKIADSATNVLSDEPKHKMNWNKFIKAWPKAALGIAGLSLLTLVLVFPWL